MSADLARLSAAEIARGVKAKKFSATEAAEACLERAEKVGPSLNTWITLDREGALKAAKDVDDAIAAGRDPGPMAGVPIGLKDLIDVAGLPTTGGSSAEDGRIPEEDALLTRKFREAGAVILGKLNLHEYAYGPTGHNIHFGDQKNPWDPARVTGGSSGGSGNAVATAQVSMAIGSDTGGSIRIPAALCGTFGHKPTFGLVTKSRCLPLCWSLDTFGPLARTAEDCALTMSVISGYDPDDPSSAEGEPPDFMAALEKPLKGFRIGNARSYYEDRSEPTVAELLENTARLLSEAGAEVVDIDIPDFRLATDASANLMMPEAYAVHEKKIRERPGDLDPRVVERLQMGYFIPAAQYIQARRFREQWTRRVNHEVFGKVDAVLSATVPTVAPLRDQKTTTFEGKDVPAWRPLISLTRLINYYGGPSMAFPAGFSPDNLPVSAQLFGPPFSDARIIAAVHQLEKAGGTKAEIAPFEG